MANFKEEYPSYKTPGVYPSGSDISIGLDNTNLLDDSLGNWNSLVRDLDSTGEHRVFISFASDSPLVTPTVDENQEAITQGRPIYYKITENLIRDHGLTSIMCKGISRQDWYQEGDSGFNNRRRYKQMRGELKERLSEFDSVSFGPRTVEMSTGEPVTYSGGLPTYPLKLSEEFFYDSSYTPTTNDPEDINVVINYAPPEQVIHFHELMNRYKYILMHYWDVTSSEVNQYIDDTWDWFRAGANATQDSINTTELWNQTFGGKFKTELFDNPISLLSPLSFISQNADAVPKANEADGILPTNYKILNEDEVNLDGITFRMPIRPLEFDDAWFIPESDKFGMHIDGHINESTANNQAWRLYYNRYIAGQLEYKPFPNLLPPWDTMGEWDPAMTDTSLLSAEILYFPRRIALQNPSEILDTSATTFGVTVLQFPVFFTEEDPVENIIVENFNTNQDETSTSKLGYPYFSFDYIFGGGEYQDDIEVPLTATETDNFVVNCYVTSENKDIPLKYYDVGTEDYRSTSYPLNINLNITLLDFEGEYSDPFGGGFGRSSVYELLNLLYGSADYVNNQIENIAEPPYHYRFEVVQWGDEDVLLTDDQIEASFYFKMYDVENYPPETDSYEYKKFVQSHVNSKPINSIANHVYSSPGVKKIKIIVYKMTSNGLFVLQTYLVEKNIMISDGNLSSQDFSIFGIGDFKFLPIKNNQAVIGALTSDSFYNQSISKLVKDNNFTKEDFPEKVSSVGYLDKFNDELLGEGLAKIDLGQTRMFNTPKDIYSFIGGDRLKILTNTSQTLPMNSSATDIFIKDDNCIVDLNPANHDFFAIRNQIGGKGQGVIVGDYKLTQPPAGRVRREGDMDRPEIVTEKDRQAF